MKNWFFKWGLLPAGKLGRKEILLYVKQKGWRWFALAVAIYAVRDIVLYLLLPYLALKKMSGL